MAFSFGYTPASQIAQQTRNNDTYAWNGHYNVDRTYAVNGLNQYTSAGGATFTYDANGNLTSDGATTYVYDIENRLVSASGAKSTTLRYDPLGRLYETIGGGTTTRLLYDGDALVAEYNGAGTLLRRYAQGKNVDDPVVWYEGAGTTTPRWLHSDHQGSPSRSPTVPAMRSRPTATTNMAFRRLAIAGGSSTPDRLGSPSSAYITTRHASTRRRADGSSKPIPSDMMIKSTSMRM